MVQRWLQSSNKLISCLASLASIEPADGIHGLDEDWDGERLMLVPSCALLSLGKRADPLAEFLVINTLSLVCLS